MKTFQKYDFLNLRIESSRVEDAESLSKIQSKVFQKDLEIYKDVENCLANEKRESIEREVYLKKYAE